MSNQTRPPITTILGHVDHGKTSLLDFIRKASVVSREHGGITQAIGAYQTEHEGKLITFIDTPGHAAFEKMRGRGAKVADIAVLVVAVDDGVMPQTVEAIKHIIAANVPMIVAVNKIDLPGVNIQAQMEKIKRQLADNKVLVEEYGGDVPIIQLSAKTGDGVDKLLEMILLISEIREISGDPTLPAEGVVIESNVDKSMGPVATVIIRNGTLKKGEQVQIAGISSKIRGLVDYNGKPLDSAPPSTPAMLLGLESVPPVGGILGDMTKIVEKEREFASLLDRLKEDKTEVLNVIVKGDKQGSVEAIIDALNSLNAEKQVVKVVSSATGDINDSDVKLAASIKAIIVGFGVKAVPTAQKIAVTEHVLIRTYNIIYELLDELKDVIEGMLTGELSEEVFGIAQVLAEFPYGDNQKIAGCRVLDGVFSKGPKIRLVRGEEVIAEGKIKSLKKAREEVTRVEKGDDCGMMFEPALEFQVGDSIESFRTL